MSNWTRLLRRAAEAQQNPCLETRKIHFFDYSLSSVGREEVKCMVRRRFCIWVSLGWRMRYSRWDRSFNPGGQKWARGCRDTNHQANSVGYLTFKMRPKLSFCTS